MRVSFRHVLPAVTALALSSMAGCGGNYGMPMPPGGPSPSPAPTPVIASAYILPGADSAGDWAFGDEPIVIHKGERLRWVNADKLTHAIVADSPDSTDFRKTAEMPAGSVEQPLTMTKLGTTRIHCTIHPSMTGTLIVREQ